MNWDRLVDVDSIDQDVLDDVLRRLGLDDGVKKRSIGFDRIKNMTVREVFNLWLEWHGMIGWTSKICLTLDSLAPLNG